MGTNKYKGSFRFDCFVNLENVGSVIVFFVFSLVQRFDSGFNFS